MKNELKPHPATLWILIGLLVILGLNAIGAGGAFMIAPDGRLIQMPLSNLEKSPFSNFLIPGLFLFIFIGVYPILIAYSLLKLPPWKRPNVFNPFKQLHWSWAGSLAAGVALIIWIIIQIQWVTIHILHIIFLVWGFLILVVTMLPGVRRYCTLKV